MDVEVNYLSTTLVQGNPSFNFIPLVPQHICANNVEVLNLLLPLEYEISTEPSSLAIILYSMLYDGK